MIRFIKRWFAIQSYVWKLSQELARRFDKRPCYSIEDVTKAAEGLKLDMAFIAYAHAIFCSRRDFDSYYGPLHLKTNYDSLRGVVSRRYFEGNNNFDAADVIVYAKQFAAPSYHESGKGYDGAQGSGH